MNKAKVTLSLIAFALLVSCASQQSATPDPSMVMPTTSLQVTSTPETNIKVTASPSIEPTPEPTLETTKLFDEIYTVYAEREQSFEFSAVVNFLEGYDTYQVTIKEPTETDVGQITVEDGTGDQVYFAFAPASDGREMIMTVSYFQAKSNSEVSLSNYSSDCDPSYDSFETHVLGEAGKEVSGVFAQTIFLFA